MNAIRLIALTLCALAFSAMAAAETVTSRNASFPVTVERPEGWTSAQDSDRAIFSFLHADTNSQIEVIGTQLLTADVASVFFETFHESLRSNFTQTAQEETVIGEREGTRTLYTFDHSGISLRVSIFQFVHGNVAWIVVAYTHVDVADQQQGAWEQVIGSLAESPAR